MTGGNVFRGSGGPALQGKYFFADLNGSLWSLRHDGEVTTDFVEHGTEFIPAGLTIVSFGEDGAGELYIVDHGGSIYKIVDTSNPEITSASGGGLYEAGDRITLSVEITGTQGSVVYEWFKDGSPVPVADGGHISGAGTGAITLDPAEETDSGVYVLEATDESKQTVAGPPIALTVVAEGALPALGLAGLGAAMGIIAYLFMERRSRQAA